MAEAGPRRRPFDQPGDVGEHRLAVLAFDRPQRRRQGREGIVGDLRRRPGQRAEQRALARVRQPDQADVGEQLQPQLDPVGLALGAFLGEARRLPHRGREATVAVAAATALGDHRALAGLDQVDRRRPRPSPPGCPAAPGYPVLAARPVPVGSFAVAPPLGPEVFAAPQRPEIAPRRIADEHDVSPVPAVAAVGPAPRHVGFTPEGDAAVAARRRPRPRFLRCRPPHQDSRRAAADERLARPRPRAAPIRRTVTWWCFFGFGRR